MNGDTASACQAGDPAYILPRMMKTDTHAPAAQTRIIPANPGVMSVAYWQFGYGFYFGQTLSRR